MEITALGRIYGASLALLLEMSRLSGTRWVHRHDGWIAFNQDMLSDIGLTRRQTRSKAVDKLLREDVIEVRGTPGSRLEYRLKPHWANPKAKVIDLGAVRQAKGKGGPG